MGVIKRDDRACLQLWNVPTETKQEFKKTCEEQGRKMVSVVVEFMDIYIENPDFLYEYVQNKKTE